MDKKDLIPACLQAFQDDPQFRVSLKSAMPVKSHRAFNAVQREGMFLPNGMMSQAGHAFIKELNAALPVVEVTLATHGDDMIAAHASSWRSGVKSRKSAHDMANQPAPPSLLKRAGSLVKALGSETKAIAQGQPTLTEQQVAARLALCEKCDQFKPNRTCGKCGCFMDAKARMRSQSCPIGKW